MKVTQFELHYPRLRDAYAVIDGIPEHNINLTIWLNPGSEPVAECGTIACAAGWLCLYPGFNELGLHLDPGSPLPNQTICPKYDTTIKTDKHTRCFSSDYGFSALAQFFGLTWQDSWAIFGSRRTQHAERYQPDPITARKYSDKKLWQHRVRTFLKQQEAVSYGQDTTAE